MSTYRLLVDHYINNQILPAGSIQVTQDVSASGNLPANFKPSCWCDPQDNAALTAFYNQGPQPLFYEFNGLQVSPPQTFWKATNLPGGRTSYSLTDLGQALTPINE
jgi:hypothetical protein